MIRLPEVSGSCSGCGGGEGMKGTSIGGGSRDGRKLDVYHRGEPLVAWKLAGNICIYCIPDHSSLYVNGV